MLSISLLSQQSPARESLTAGHQQAFVGFIACGSSKMTVEISSPWAIYFNRFFLLFFHTVYLYGLFKDTQRLQQTRSLQHEHYMCIYFRVTTLLKDVLTFTCYCCSNYVMGALWKLCGPWYMIASQCYLCALAYMVLKHYMKTTKKQKQKQENVRRPVNFQFRIHSCYKFCQYVMEGDNRKPCLAQE